MNDSLSDTSGGSGNSFTCDNGFNLWIKPTYGDLLGSTFTTMAPGDAVVVHNWAGTNVGPSYTGYTNNVAVGKLVLSPQSLKSGPVFEFSGTGVSNALYVDYLDLSQLSTNYAAMLQIDPNLVIYYAAAALGFIPPPAANGLPPQEPEEYLNGQFGGHLRWVQTFAGPNSSVAVVINGQSYLVNRALRFATTIDSNSNGIPNYADSNPFNTPPPGSIPLLSGPSALTLSVSIVQPTSQSLSNSSQQISSLSSPALAIAWLAASNTIYQVQFTTNLPPVNWQLFLTYTNSAPSSQMVTVWDTNAPAATSRRFYRIGYGP